VVTSPEERGGNLAVGDGEDWRPGPRREEGGDKCEWFRGEEGEKGKGNRGPFMGEKTGVLTHDWGREEADVPPV